MAEEKSFTMTAEVVLPQLVDPVQKEVETAFYGIQSSVRLVVLAFVQIVRIFLGSLVGPLITGIIQGLGDHIVRPVLAAINSAILQPGLQFAYGVTSGLNQVLVPVGGIFATILAPVYKLLQSFRLFDIRNIYKTRVHEMGAVHCEEI